MSALTSRIALTGPPAESPEDFLSTALSTLDPDDALNIHGDADHGLLYTSPHLPRPLHLDLADPAGDEDRKLFSHYLWNSSLLLAELIEAAALDLAQPASGPLTAVAGPAPSAAFDPRHRSTIELGAGTALPSLIAALLGAARVLVTDYPAPAVLKTLKDNVARNTATSSRQATVEGHAWGELSTPPASGNQHAFDRVLAADCLWMPWQHDALRKSMSWFLKRDAEARVWIVAGFHTGREKVSAFFDGDELVAVDLEVEAMWERDVEGVERAWASEREGEDPRSMKRWLVVAILKRPGPRRQDPS